MDISSTAQTATPVVAASLPWWHYLVTFVVGIFAKPIATKALELKPAVTNIVTKAEALAPVAETIATLAGQPALAGGIEAAAAIAKQVASVTDPNQLAALAVMHAQALAAAGAPPALAPSAPVEAPQEAAPAPQTPQAPAAAQQAAQARP